MWTTTHATYASAFVARHTTPDQQPPHGPGMHGPSPTTAASPARLLITDDRAREELAALLPVIRTGSIDVFAGATRCTALISAHLGWKSTTATAMACRDLRTVPEVTLTNELTLRPVRRLPGDPTGGVPLEEAVAVAVSADPTLQESPSVLSGYLRSLPSTVRLFAAVDSQGIVQATSGVDVVAPWATVIFVNTDPRWRLRGVGKAMTATALNAARAGGAEQACLNASDAGLSIYQRLGFETVARVTRFSRPH